MRKFNTYQPEDIEQLMLEKSFEELLDKEKAFVLEHVDGIAEYQEMRKLLLSIKENASDDEIIEPPSYMRKQLLDDFIAKQRKNPFIILIQELKNLFKRPSFQIGLASFGILLFAFIVFRFHDFNSNNQLAINEENPKHETTLTETENLVEETIPVETREKEKITGEEMEDFSSLDIMDEILKEEENDEEAFPKTTSSDFSFSEVPSSSQEKSDRNKDELAFQDQEVLETKGSTRNNNTVHTLAESGNRKTSSKAVGGMSIAQKGSKLEDNKEIFFNIMYAAN